MKFTRIHINRFGRLQNRTIDFVDGIHVIYGPNESGKSTLHAFFEAMLFGMERGRGRAAKHDSYTRYYPKEGGSTYGGVLEFVRNDNRYSIYRNFDRDPVGCSLLNETDGRQMKLTDEEYRQLLAGMTRPLYRDTISLGQLQAATSDQLPALLRNHIVNLKSTGSSSLDISRAHERLKSWRKELNSQIVRGAEEGRERCAAQIQEIRGRLDTLPVPDELEQVENERDQAAAAAAEKIRERQSILDAISRQQEIEGSAPVNRHSRPGGSAHPAGRSANTSQTEHPEDVPSDAHSGFSPAAARSGATSGLFPVMIVLALVLAAASVFCGLRGIPLLCGFLAAAAAISAAAGFIIRSQSRARWQRAAQASSEIRSLRREEEQAAEQLSSLRKRQHALEEQRSTLQHGLWEREQREQQLRDLEEQLDLLTEKAASNRSLREEIASLDLAAKTIDRLAEDSWGDFGSYLQETASELISQITGGRYLRLIADDDLNITLEQSDHQLAGLSSLSCSTLDQVYLALRIACVRFFWKEEPMPLLLDETFAMYDADRMRETLSWLSQSYPGQVLIFTCHHREEEVMDGAGIPFTKIRLNETGH